jgi:hypothetical protein
MLAREIEHPAKVHQSLPVELQGLYRGAARWRQANNADEIMAPDEVIPPMLRPRVKKWGYLPRGRITAPSSGVLMVVASLAGKGQIRGVVSPAFADRNDVFEGERLHGEAFLAAAVLASLPGTGADLGPFPFWAWWLRHPA